MGVRFVNREDPRAAARATLRLIREARSGGSLAIFPEGTFQKDPGLLPFYSGAFLIAAKIGLPVVPAVMRGTRSFFHDGARWPSYCSIEINILDPLRAASSLRVDADQLKDSAYRIIDDECREENELMEVETGLQ
jgi:1-acyl-sn-glycerol-3-phosphate acyltransferase